MDHTRCYPLPLPSQVLKDEIREMKKVQDTLVNFEYLKNVVVGYIEGKSSFFREFRAHTLTPSPLLPWHTLTTSGRLFALGGNDRAMLPVIAEMLHFTP